MAQALLAIQIGSAVFSAAQESAELKGAARNEELAARQERIRGEADALAIEKDLNEKLATNIARSFGAGGAIGGSNAAIIQQVLSEGSFASRMALRSGEQRAQQRRASAASLRSSARFAFVSGLIRAGGVALRGVQDIRERKLPSQKGTRTPRGGQTRTR